MTEREGREAAMGERQTFVDSLTGEPPYRVCGTCGERLPRHYDDCKEAAMTDEAAMSDEIDRLRAEVTRCQEENTREVERRRELQGRYKNATENTAYWIEKTKRLERERDELKARLAKVRHFCCNTGTGEHLPECLCDGLDD